MARKQHTISIVCPTFNEEEVLPAFHQELCAAIVPLEDEYTVEIIYVDDGSQDRTLEVIKLLAASDSRVRYFSFSRNFGHQAALTAGLEHATGDAVITLDSDLQHPPALLPVLLRKWREGFDVVLTIRQEDPSLRFVKRFTSRLFYRLMRLLSSTDIRMAAADYRLMSRRAVNALLKLRETHRFLRGMVQWLGFPTAEVSFQPGGRKAGVSKYGLRRMLNLASDGILSFSRVPLRFATFLGLGVVACGLIGSVCLAGHWLLSPDNSDSGWAVLLVTLQLLGGSILCALGLIGEYVGRIYEQVKGRPLYVLKEHSGEADEQEGRAEETARDAA